MRRFRYWGKVYELEGVLDGIVLRLRLGVLGRGFGGEGKGEVVVE